MNERRLGYRYAKAIFSFALEQKKLSEFLRDIELYAAAIKYNPNFRSFLTKDIISDSDKNEVLKNIAKKYSVHSEVLNLFHMLVERRRTSLIPFIAKYFRIMRDEAFQLKG
jgi:ATP synthase F1 delta subunit